MNLTCSACAVIADYRRWKTKNGTLWCPSCGAPEFADVRQSQLADLAEDGDESAQADLFKEAAL